MIESSSATSSGPAHARRRLTPVSVGVLCLWLAVLLAGAAGGLYKWLTGYQRMVLKALNENVRYVEIEPEPGAPPVRLTSPHDIARLRGILMAATRRPAATSGPSAGANCAAKIVYGDGAVEAFQIGRIDSPRGPAMPAADGQVEVQWGGYTRYADGDGLMRLLMTPGPRETPTRTPAG